MTANATTAHTPPQDVALGWKIVDGMMWLWSRARRLLPSMRVSGYLLVLPSVGLMGLLLAGLAYVLWYSVHAYDPFYGRLTNLSFVNYSQVFQDYEWDVLLRTLRLSVVVTALSVALALPMAYVLVRSTSKVLHVFLLVALLVPFFTGEIVRAFGWMLVAGRNGGVAWLLRVLGAEDITLIGTQGLVVIGLVQLMMPLCTFVIVPSIRGIDPELEQGAATLGARRWRTWLSVILPLSVPGITGAAAIAFALSMTEYGVPRLLGGGKQDFIANIIHSTFFNQNNIALGSALGIVTLVATALGVAIIVGSGRWVTVRLGVRELAKEQNAR